MTAKRTCATCEFFDGGGLLPNGQWKEQEGDCHNRHSPRFQTSVNQTCIHYFRDEALLRSGTVTEEELASINTELGPQR